MTGATSNFRKLGGGGGVLKKKKVKLTEPKYQGDDSEIQKKKKKGFPTAQLDSWGRRETLERLKKKNGKTGVKKEGR